MGRAWTPRHIAVALPVAALVAAWLPGALAAPVRLNLTPPPAGSRRWSDREVAADDHIVHLLATEFTPPGGPRSNAAWGAVGIVVDVAESSTHGQMKRMTYDLHSVDGSCFMSMPNSNNLSCAVYIAEGNLCLRASSGATTVYAAARYVSKMSGMIGEEDAMHSTRFSTHGAIELDGGVDVERARRGTVAVHDFDGALVSCAPLESVHGCDTRDAWSRRGVVDFTRALDECGGGVYCTAEHPGCGDACAASEDCHGFPMRVCEVSTRLCRHKRLFEGGPRSVGLDLAAGLGFALVSGLSMSVGIGGGGLFVPLLGIILSINLREATALSQALLAGGSSTALLYNLRQRHPTGRKPMIDYDLVLVMGPTLLMGAFFGSLLHSAMPFWLILVLLAVVLLYNCANAFRRSWQTWRRERDEAAGIVEGEQRAVRTMSRRSENEEDSVSVCRSDANEGLAAVGEATSQRGFSKETSGSSAQLAGSPGRGGKSKAPPEALSVEEGGLMTRAISERSGGSASTTRNRGTTPKTPRLPQFPVFELSVFAATWAMVLVTTFARGGKGAKGLVAHCSPAYWSLSATIAVVLICVSMLGARRASIRNTSTHLLATPASGQLVYDAKTVVRIVVGSMGAGMLAAVCGIGGGIVMAPLLLHQGVLPQVQMASMGLTLFVMSSTTALFYIVQGMVLPDYSLFLAGATAVGAVVGRKVVSWLVRTVVRPSTLMLSLALVVAALFLVMAVGGAIDVLEDVVSGRPMGFQSLCE